MERSTESRAGEIAAALLCSALVAAGIAPVAAAPRTTASWDLIFTVAGAGPQTAFDTLDSGDGGPATEAKIHSPEGISADRSGNFYIAETYGERVRQVDSTGTITTVAGIGVAGYSGDGGPATSAQLDTPQDVAVDASGNVFIADRDNHRIRKVDPSGGIRTVAGSSAMLGFGNGGFSGDGGPATQAELNTPHGVAVDSSGNLYIADSLNSRVRKVVPGTDGVINGGEGEAITTVANANGGSVTTDHLGNVYFGDSYRVRRLDTNGIITDVAGTGTFGFSGDGGLATQAQLASVAGLAVDGVGDLFIADGFNHRVRKVDASGVITTVAGTGAQGFSGDGGPATEAELYSPSGVAIDPYGGFLVSEWGNDRVRRVGPELLQIQASDTPDPVAVGQRLTYTISVRALATATGVGVVDTLPAGASFVSAAPSQGSCSHASGTVTCGLGRMTARSTATVTITATAPGSPGEITNTATVTAKESDPYPPTNTAREGTTVSAATDPQPGTGLAVAVSDSPDPVDVNQTLTYAVTITNGLPTPATAVTLTNTLPAAVRFASASSTLGSCTHSLGTVTCQVGTLASGGVLNGTITATTVNGGVVATNVATVRAAEAPSVAPATTETKISALGCGRVLKRNTVLKADLGPCGGDGLIVGADRITLDLGGYRVFGFPGPGNGNQAGIRVPRRTGVTVTNGTVSDFDAGVMLGGGGHHTLTKLVVRDNIGPDDPFNVELGDGIVLFDSASNLIQGNTVIHNGLFDGIGVLGGFADNNVIKGNTVTDTVGPLSDLGPWGQGIIINGAGLAEFNGAIITGTRVLENTVRGNASGGLANINHAAGTIFGNRVEDNGLTHGAGNGIGVQLGPGAGGILTEMLIEGNEVHRNAIDGIQLRRGALGNTVRNNNAAGNNTKGANGFSPGFDLNDGNANCGTNTWWANTWGTGFYSPLCAGAGGTGPEPASPPPAASEDDLTYLVRREPPLPAGG